MPRRARVRVNEAWKNVSKISVRANSAWKNVKVGYVYTLAYGWKVFFGNIIPNISSFTYEIVDGEIVLSWESEKQESFIINYVDTTLNVSNQTQKIKSTVQTYTLDNLTPGSSYNITLTVFSETDDTDSEEIIGILVPIVPIVSNFQIFDETSTTASFTWYSKNQREWRIIASYDFGDGSLIKDSGWTITTNDDGQTGGTLSGLDAGTEYYDTTLYVKSITGTIASTTLIPDGRFFTRGPENIVAPVNSGVRYVGGQRSVTSGTWDGATDFSYQWVRSLTPSEPGTDIPGAGGPTYTTYTLTSSDAGYYIACKVSPRIPYFPNIIAYSNWSPLIGNRPSVTLNSIDQITSSSARYNFTVSNSPTTIYAVAESVDGFSNKDVTSPSPISSPYTISGLTSNNNYSGKIIASNEFGLINSNVIEFKTLLPLPPAPTGLQAFVQGQNQVYLDWDDVPGFDLESPYYRIQYSTNASTWTTVNGNVNSNFTVTGLSAGTLYYFRVAAVNASGTGPYSSSVTATTSPPAPGAFTLSVSNIGQTSATFSWTPSAFASSYTLFYYYNDFDEGTIYDITSTSYNVTGLTGARTYTGQVAAVNSTSVTNSNIVSFTTQTPPPPAPSINFFSVGQSDFLVTASWSVSNATSYTIAVSYLGTSTYSTTSTSYSWSKGEEIGDGLHTFTLTAFGPGGSASSSTSLNITPKPAPTPFFPPTFGPYFPPFFPFFPPVFGGPYFPPFFPFFPPFFPYFPPVFGGPYFPPFFPFFPPIFGPFFPFFPPSFKTAPAVLSMSVNNPSFLTEEYGYLSDKYLVEGDLLSALEINEDYTEFTEITTSITSINSIVDSVNIVMINGEPYNGNYRILVEKDSIIEFVKTDDIDTSYRLFDYNSKSFIEISELTVENTETEVYYIETQHPVVINSTVGFGG